MVERNKRMVIYLGVALLVRWSSLAPQSDVKLICSVMLAKDSMCV